MYKGLLQWSFGLGQAFSAACTQTPASGSTGRCAPHPHAPAQFPFFVASLCRSANVLRLFFSRPCVDDNNGSLRVPLAPALAAQANVMAKNSAGETPLHCAGRQSEDFIRALRDAGADVNAVAGPSKSTPLHSAAERGEVSAIRALLRAGANVNAANASGDTPLMVAARAGRVELMDALLKGGASVEATNKAQDTALHAAVDAGRHVVRCLLDAKAPINAANGKGLTALHLAAATANDKVAELLLKLGASAALNLPDGAGNTPLWHAVAYRPHPGWRTMVDLLVESGADAEHACMGEKTEVVSQLRAGMLMAD